MIIDYDHNPKLTYDQKLQSLKESVQMALNEAGSGGTTIIWGKLKDTFATKSHTHTEYYTKAEVDQMISDINDILADAILKSTAS